MTFSDQQEGKQVWWESEVDIKTHKRKSVVFVSSSIKLFKDLGTDLQWLGSFKKY